MTNLAKLLFTTLLGAILLVGAFAYSAPARASLTLQCPAHIADCNECPGTVTYLGEQCTTVNGRCRDLGICTTPDFYFWQCAGTPGPCN